MNETNMSRDEMFRLLSAWCSGELAERDAEMLAATLRDDAAARQLYLDYVEIHAELSRVGMIGADLPPAATERRPPKPAGESRWVRLTRRVRSSLHKASHFVRTPAGISLALAVIVNVLAVAVLSFVTVPATLRAWRQRPHEPIAAARIVGGEYSRWDESGARLSVGARLFEGQRLKLLDGLAKIEFDSGATIVLTAPSDLLIGTSTSGTLSSGRLTAKVPTPAIGFAVHTPRSTVTDLGTEFGITVYEDGAEEVHVFAGLVEVVFPGSNTPKQQLKTSQGLRVPQGDIATESLVAIAAQPQSFVRQLRSRNDELQAATPAATQPPTTRGLTMWLAADGNIRLDGQGRVSRWNDMLAGDNKTAQHAWQPQVDSRPVWVSDGIGRRPALRFNGQQFMTLARPSDLGVLRQPYEVFFVAQSSVAELQFLLAGEFCDYELHLNYEPGARFLPAGHFDGDGSSDIGKLHEFNDGRPHVFAARVSAERDYYALLQVDGVDSDDWSITDGRSWKDIPLRLGMRQESGVHGWQGEIAEVLLYRQGLTDDERQQVVQWLAQKYSVGIKQP